MGNPIFTSSDRPSLEHKQRAMSIDTKSIFKEIVENIFSRWTALKLAVEHGMGGHNGLEVIIENSNL